MIDDDNEQTEQPVAETEVEQPQPEAEQPQPEPEAEPAPEPVRERPSEEEVLAMDQSERAKLITFGTPVEGSAEA